MPDLTVHKQALEALDELGVRAKGAYEATVTEGGLIVSDSRILFNRHFVRKEAQEVADELALQRCTDRPLYPQEAARERLQAAQAEAQHAGQLLGHVAAVPALRVRAERLAGIRFRTSRAEPWRYVWVDAYRLRLLMALFNTPLRFFCADWDRPVVLKRGKRTVGCIMPAARHPLDIRIDR